MSDVITIGSALVDIFIHSGQFMLRQEGDLTYVCQIYGDKIEVDKFDFLTGGGGSNTAVGFARRGYDTSVVTETGRDVWSNYILDELTRERVHTTFIQVEKKEQTGGSVILVGNDGGRTVMVHRGAASMLDPKDIPSDKVSEARWVHMSSISGRHDTLNTVFEAVRNSSRQDQKTRLSWNPGKRELALIAADAIDMAKVPCTILIVNKQEWDSIQNVHQVVHDTIEQIVVTDGRNGGAIYCHGECLHQYEVSPIEAKEETGAGDAFSVGYISGYLEGKSIEAATQMGQENAASVVQHVGAKPGLLPRNFSS